VSHNYEVINLEPPEMEIVIVVPEVHHEKKTRLARTLLPDKVWLRDAIHNIGNASKMVAAVALKDPVLFGRSISDNLIEPHRAVLIPNFWKVKEAALDSGAYGCSIAGGGPTVFAVGENSAEIKGAMEDAFRDVGVKSESFLVKPSAEGARVL
jgi:homoserine kinase